MCQKLLIIISNIQFLVWDTNFSHFSPKNFWIQIFVMPTTKMLQKPIFRLFRASERVWGALSQIFGKSQIFSGQLDHKKEPPPYGRVKQILTIVHVPSFHVYETICMIANLNFQSKYSDFLCTLHWENQLEVVLPK